MPFSFVDFFAVVGLGPAPVDPSIPEPDPSDPIALNLPSATVVRRRRISRVRGGGLQCVATAHFNHDEDLPSSGDPPGFSQLFGTPQSPAILDCYPLSKNRDEIADALPQFCFPTGLYLGRSGALPTYFRIVLTDVEGSRMLVHCLQNALLLSARVTSLPLGTRPSSCSTTACRALRSCRPRTRFRPATRWSMCPSA